MAADQGPVVQSALLRGELTRLRKEKGLTQEQVAAQLEWSPSKLIRIEGGRSSITKVDLDALLRTYGVTSEPQRERLTEYNRGAHERGWWEVYKEDTLQTYLTYVGYEAGAASIRQFLGTVVPGLLQTAEYAEEQTAVTVDEPVKIASVVKLRLQRQSELAKRMPRPRQYYVMDEAVIRRHVGVDRDPAIMPNQLRYIVEKVREDERITVRVIPFSSGAHAGLTGPFTLLEFDGGLPDILYLDAGREIISMIASDDPKVAEYADNFEKLLSVALPARESTEFIQSVAEEMS
jgi:transcriptional regulator with XRE-family HTH domain